MRFLVKVVVAIVCYIAVFALAAYALIHMSDGGGAPKAVLAILIILAFFGYRAVRHLPLLIFSGGVDGQGFVYTLIMLFLRVLLSVLLGMFIAPWVIAKKAVSLIPGGEAKDIGDSN